MLSTTPKRNLITVQLDASRETVTYNPAQLKAQTRESRTFQKKVREIAEGERIRFTRHDKEMGVYFGDLATVTRIGQGNSITVKLDSGKTAELSPEESRHIDYGYAVESLKGNRAERVIANGDGLTQQVFRALPQRPTRLIHRHTSSGRKFLRGQRNARAGNQQTCSPAA